MPRLFALLLSLCIVLSFGCAPRQDGRLYIYCNETFWYVIQEQALSFNRIYGSQIILIPIRAEQTQNVLENGIEIETGHRVPVPWEFMLSEEITGDPNADDPRRQINFNQIHPDIVQQIERIEDESIRLGDLFISDSPRHLDMVRGHALSADEFLVCYLTLSMLVPMGNPNHFRSVRDVLDTHRRLGMMNPTFDGLGEASWIVLRRMFSGDESAIPMELISIYERQFDLLEALELGYIDAALVWDATSQINFLLVKYADQYNEAYADMIRQAERRRDHERLRDILQVMYEQLVETHTFAEVVPLTENPDERLVVAVRLVALSSATNFGHCKRFADFLRSPLGRGIFRRFGFVAE